MSLRVALQECSLDSMSEFRASEALLTSRVKVGDQWDVTKGVLLKPLQRR